MLYDVTRQPGFKKNDQLFTIEVEHKVQIKLCKRRRGRIILRLRKEPRHKVNSTIVQKKMRINNLLSACIHTQISWLQNYLQINFN